MNKPDFCSRCPINHCTQGYVPLDEGGDILFVAEASGAEEAAAGKPFVGGAGQWFNSLLKAAGIDRRNVSIINTIGCRPPDNVYPSSRDWSVTDHATGRAAVEYCYANHLRPALLKRPWKKIVALGNEALKALTGKNGILKWRGSPLPLRVPCRECYDREHGVRIHIDSSHPCRLCENRGWYWSTIPLVMPTLHPAYLMRQASMFSQVVRDIQKPLLLSEENYELWATSRDLEKFNATVFAFDLEWGEFGNIIICGLSDGFGRCLVADWKKYKAQLRGIFESATDLIGQNIVMADLPHLRAEGFNITARLHDTMLMQHLIQPDFRHDLGTICSIFTNKVFWKGKDTDDEEDDVAASDAVGATGAQWKTWNDPDAIPVSLGGYGGLPSAEAAYRLYNARDTEGTFQAFFPIQNTLKKYGMEEIYWNLQVPVAHECRRMADLGFKIDRTKLQDINTKLTAEIEELEQQLPEALRPRMESVGRNIPAPTGTFRSKTKRCRGSRQLGTKHDSVNLVFDRPSSLPCPICNASIASGKMVEAKIIRVERIEKIVPWNSTQQVQVYAESVGCAPFVNKKSKRKTGDKNARKVWGREHPEFTIIDQIKKRSTLRSNFAKQKLLGEERIYFNLLPHGTAEGRLSSSGRRHGIDPNIQNQPDDIRFIFVPDHDGWGILDVDWAQGENRLTAWLAKDYERLERLNTPGYDEHSALASEWFQCEVTKHNENKHFRDAGKIINHGLNYGAGPFKIQELLIINGFNYQIHEIKEGVASWRKINGGTYDWQQRTVSLVKAQGFLANPFGRKRWFQNRDYATKALAFLPASTLADMMLRVLLAMYPNRWGVELANLGVKITGNLPVGWDLRFPVHDSMVLQGPDNNHRAALDVVSPIMGQPWAELDGFALGVSAKYSTVSWGDCKELN